MCSELTIIRNMVYDKLEKELEDFKSKLKTKSPDEIIKSSYELVAKEDILTVFSLDGNFNLSQYQTLLKTKNPLNYLYQEWLDFDSLEINYIQECISFAIEKQSDYFKSNTKSEKDCR